jgi:hypothetical protein
MDGCNYITSTGRYDLAEWRKIYIACMEVMRNIQYEYFSLEI